MSRIANDRPLLQRDPPVRDPAFIHWLHVDMPCIGCLLEPRAHGPRFRIEAAHQKLPIASRGWSGGGAGPKVHDRRTVPLCSGCHRLFPNACDNGQRTFWDRIGLGDAVADFAEDLYEAYQRGQSGAEVVRRYAAKARAVCAGRVE